MQRLGRVLGNLLAVALTVVSLQAVAETQMGGRDFNHMTTGFPLTGGHAAAACETCHMGGVFKGLPTACDGCHIPGGRIVATPKSTSHIVTTAPCESCHFNAATWLGARFNHGTARPGECTTCHNGRISTGKPTLNHPVTTAECDQCHRRSAWTPASWNHTGVTGDCATCHKAGGPGRNFTTNAAAHSQYAAMGVAGCNVCHTSYYSFSSVYYNHAGASPLCGSCHNNPAYSGAVAQVNRTSQSITDHAVFARVGITNCQSCHKSFAKGSFPSGRYDHAGAGPCQTCHTAGNSPIRAMATNHIPILVSATCTACHYSSASWAAEVMAHNPAQVALTPCTTCHLRGNTYLGRMDKQRLHELSRNPAATDCSASGCHKPLGSKGVLYQKWD